MSNVTDFSLDRGLPAAPDVEKSVLGSLIVEPNLLKDAAVSLSTSDFFLDAHRRLFATMVAFVEDGTPVDSVTLATHLRQSKELEAVGGVAYISTLTDGVPRRESISHYVKILREKATLRNVIHAASGIAAMAIDGSDSAEVVLQRMADAHSAISASAPSHSSIRTLSDIPDVMALKPTPIEHAVEGLILKDGVTLFVGPSGVGKSLMLLRMCISIAMGTPFMDFASKRLPVLYLDYENQLAIVQSRQEAMAGGTVPGLNVWGRWLSVEMPMVGNPDLLRIAKDERPVIIIDPLIRFLPPGTKENASEEIAPCMEYFRKLAIAGATVVLVHHAGKNPDIEYRGSSDILAGCDGALSLRSDTDGLLLLHRFKHRAAPKTRWTIKPDFEIGSFEITESVAEQNREADIALIDQTIASKPGLSQREIARSLDGQLSYKRVREVMRSAGDRWVVNVGPRNSHLYSPSI
jgi:hypothetical protein